MWTRHVFDKTDGADRVHIGLAFRESLHETDDTGRSSHVAFHILHPGCGFDRNAAGVETNALADESDRLRFGLGTVLGAFPAAPAHDDGAALASRPLPNPEKRAHAEFAHCGIIEDRNLDAVLLKRQGAIGELFRIEDVRRFVDKRAGSQHSGRHRLPSFGGLADAGRLLDGNQDMGAALRLLVIFLLGLILIEAVIPQPHTSREVGSRVCRLLGRPRRIEGDHRICLTAKLANHEATKFRVIFWLRRHIRFAFAFPLLIAAIGAGANHDEPFGGKPGRRNEIERGQCLPLELHGSGSLFDQNSLPDLQ